MTMLLRSVAISLLAVTSARSQEMLFEHVSSEVIDRAVVIEASRFSLETLRKVAKEFLAEQPRSRALARLTIATSRQDAELALFQLMMKAETSANYGDTTALIRQRGKPQTPLAQVFYFDGHASLIVRMDGKVVTEQLAGTRDAREIQVGHRKFTILHFSYAENKAPATPLDKAALTLFVRADAPLSISATIALLNYVTVVSGAGFVILHVREDIWFLASEDYPYLWPFIDKVSVPTESAFRSAPRVDCVYTWRFATSCSGKDFMP